MVCQKRSHSSLMGRGNFALLAIAALNLTACTPTSPDMTSAELAVVNQETHIYCSAIEVDGVLAENLAHLDPQPDCQTSPANDEDMAVELSASGRVDAHESNRLGVAFELSLSARAYKRPLRTTDLQASGGPIDSTFEVSATGLGSGNVARHRLEYGKEAQYSTPETVVRLIDETPFLTLVCVDAIRRPAGRKPLDVMICRNVTSAFGDGSYLDEAKIIIRDDMPRIAGLKY